MRQAGAWGLALVLAAALPVAVPAPAEAEAAVTLAPDALRDLAYAALQAGDAARALELTAALLARDPADAGALIIRSRAFRALNRLPEAEEMARAAFRAADSYPLKYGAALSLAQALSLQGERTRAQIWLRRANHYATTEEQLAQVAGDYAYVRQQNPLSLRFDASIQPSNNVNNGSMRSVWDFFGIPLQLSGDAQALSGIVGDFTLSGSYRLAQSPRTHDALNFSLTDHEVFLSPEARAQAPMVDNGDYRQTSISGGYQHRSLLSADGSILTSALTLGRNWYGDAGGSAEWWAMGPLSNSATLSFDLTRPYGPGAQNFLHVEAERNARLDAPLSSSNTVALSGGFAQGLASGDQIRATFGVARVMSEDVMVDHTTMTAEFDYTLGKPLAGIKWSATMAGEVAAYGVSPFSATGDRDDLSITLGLTGELTTMSIYGFSPVVTVTGRATNSNVDLYDTRSLGVGLSFRSRF